jgi:hypothetical protein
MGTASRLLFAALLLSAPVASARTATAPQQFKSGAVVKLRALDIELKLPPSAEGWTVSLAVEGADAWDILQRLDQNRGELTIELSRARVADCGVVASTLDKQKAAKHANTPLAPTSFEPWSYKVASGAQRLCTNTYNGPVTADVSGTALDAAEVSAMLAEVAKMVSGRRGTAGLAAKAPTVAILGKTLLPGSGVYADIPKGWSLRVVEGGGGNKIDLIERTEPSEPSLKVIVERRVAACATALPQGKSILDAPYLPEGFGPASIETRDKDVRTATFCMEQGADAIVASIQYNGELTHADVRNARAILAPAAGGRSIVGTSIASEHDVDEREDEMQIGARIRGVVALDLHYLSAKEDSNKPFGAGLSLDAYSSTARHGLGFAVEVGARGAIGSNKFLMGDVHGGIGAALTFGRFIGLLTVGAGVDVFETPRPKCACPDAPLRVPAAGYVHVAPRVIIPLARKLAVDLRGAYVHRFEDTFDRELRAHLGVNYASTWFGARITRYSDRALLATLVLGFAF